MKKQFLSVLAFTAILLSSCGGTAKIEKASACGQEGEITASSATAIAETESGKVAGYVENGIYIYKGIPYAKAERFMPPVAADKWEGVRSSRAYGPTCPQGKRMGWYSDEQAFAFNWDDGYPDENCLRVNIWTPGLKDGKKRPVMVWLHGGGYSAGSGQELPSYDGTNLAKKGDAVVVTLNHRLNVLGFLDLSAYGDKYAKSGNAGLLDLVAALQWVNKNIESFGGDARNVTIFGQSGGGGKVSTLLATPSARGLFHKAIVQSGSMLRTMEQKYSRRIGSAVMEELGLNASQIDELQKVPYDKLLAAGDKADSQSACRGREGGGVFLHFWLGAYGGRRCTARTAFRPSSSSTKQGHSGDDRHYPARVYRKHLLSPPLRSMTKEQVVEQILQKKYGERTDDFLKAFEQAYPGYQPKDLVDVDFIFRPGAVEQAKLKVGTARCTGLYVYVCLGIARDWTEYSAARTAWRFPLPSTMSCATLR